MTIQQFYLNLYYNNYIGYKSEITSHSLGIVDYLVNDWKISLEGPLRGLIRMVIIDTDHYFNSFYDDEPDMIVIYNEDFKSFSEANDKRKLIKHLIKEDDYSWTQSQVDDESYLVYIIFDSDFKILKNGVL